MTQEQKYWTHLLKLTLYKVVFVGDSLKTPPAYRLVACWGVIFVHSSSQSWNPEGCVGPSYKLWALLLFKPIWHSFSSWPSDCPLESSGASLKTCHLTRMGETFCWTLYFPNTHSVSYRNTSFLFSLQTWLYNISSWTHSHRSTWSQVTSTFALFVTW